MKKNIKPENWLSREARDIAHDEKKERQVNFLCGCALLAVAFLCIILTMTLGGS